MSEKRLSVRFTRTDLLLWAGSAVLIFLSFLLFDRGSVLTLAASLTGVTSLIFNAKGHPFGQLLMVVFSVMYGVISWDAAYYGEMITYLGMSMPMAVFALVSWLRNPFEKGKSEVRVNRIGGREAVLLVLLTAGVTVGFYFILEALHTANLLPSTLSVATSFLAAYLTFRRSAGYALAYAANDRVLIVLWTLDARRDPASVSVIVCFVVFLANDLYGYISWRRMRERQRRASAAV